MTLTKQNLKVWIPWGMAAGRAALGPVLIAGARCYWSPLALAGIVVVALLSDIFDGVLARRWGTDTAGVRLFDSIADMWFYLCVAGALWVARPEVLHSNAWLLRELLVLEAARLGFDFVKFGKLASYHSYLAKTWGMVMAVAVTEVFALGRGNGLVPASLVLGIACNLEGLVMSVMLPVWRQDVKSLGAAWRIRVMSTAKVSPLRRKIFAAVLVVVGVLVVAEPSFAVSAGEAAYAGGTAPVANGTMGTLDLASAETLAFRYTTSNAAQAEIDIPYAQVINFQYATEVAHHIGVLPAIAVSLVKKRERKHLFTISYRDSADATQVVVLEVPKDRSSAFLAVLRARASQVCSKVSINFCGVKPVH